MITGCVVIDLTTEDRLHDVDGARLAELDLVPDGCEVVVNIGNRSYVSQRAADLLHEHDHRLSIRISGVSAAGVGRFVRAARDGCWSVVA